MKTIKRLAVLTGLVATLMFGVSHLYAAPPHAVPQGPPVWCWGVNSIGQCVLFLGNEQTCMNVEQCIFGSLAVPTPTDPLGGIHFCQGMQGDECVVFLGDENACNNVEPCLATNGQLPRAPRLAADRIDACAHRASCSTATVCEDTQGNKGECLVSNVDNTCRCFVPAVE